jgi:hypothetical protein
MRSVIAATILVIACAAASDGQTTRSEPVCRADQNGARLITTIEYRDGYRVDAPWRVTSEGKFRTGGSRLTAALDHIIETDALTGKRQVISLPGAVEMTFKGVNREQLLREAAEVWCATVGKAMAERTTKSLNRVAHNPSVM